jgi:3-(3-hydroxy-phenyl)propionate hydroxylase
MDPIVSEPVLIAGAGPVGCSIALYLAQHGVPVVLFEAELEPPLDLRASTFHPPTLDMLDTLGIAAPLIELGLIAPTYQYRDRRTGEAAIFDLGTIADQTRFPFRLQCEQYHLTKLVVQKLAEYPHARVLFNQRVESIEQDGRGVTVYAESPTDGFGKYRGSYLVGADGSNSRVRKMLAISFEGFTYPERFLVVSTPLELAEVLPGLSYVNYVADTEEWCVLLRTRSLWRVLVPTPQNLTDSQLLHDDFVQARLRHLTSLPGPFTIGHRTLYRVHQRVANKWRIGRVLLAGDACHVNNPLGGMGMNGGLHDAFNLADKLVTIFKGAGSEHLLDLYERQRRGICVKFVQEHTIKNKQMLEDTSAQAQAARQAEFMRIAADQVAAREFLLRNTMITSLREAAQIT